MSKRRNSRESQKHGKNLRRGNYAGSAVEMRVQDTEVKVGN